MQDEYPSATGGEHILTPPPPVGSNSSGVRTLKFFTPARPTCCGWGPPALSGGGARTVPVRSSSAERETGGRFQSTRPCSWCCGRGASARRWQSRKMRHRSPDGRLLADQSWLLSGYNKGISQGSVPLI